MVAGFRLPFPRSGASLKKSGDHHSNSSGTINRGFFKLKYWNKEERALVTRIRAKDVTRKMKRIPVGFYVTIASGEVTQQTSIVAALVHADVVEWDDEIFLPSNRSSKISFTLVASFELGPILGRGEPLHKFESTVSELLDRNADSGLVQLSEQDNEDGSLVDALEIEIEQRVCGRNEYLASVASHSLEPDENHRLEKSTDMGHNALAHYRDDHVQEYAFLDESMKHFELALDICPQEHPCRAVVLFNLATVRMIHYRVKDASSDLDTAIDLFRIALDLRPRGHPDHSFTLLSHLQALQARSQRRQDRVEKAEAQTLLSEIPDVFQEYSYAYVAALLARCSIASRPEFVAQTEDSQITENNAKGDGKSDNGNVSQEIYPSELIQVDPLDILFCTNSNAIQELVDPVKTILKLEEVVKSIPNDHPDKASGLYYCGNLFMALYHRFNDAIYLDKSISLRESTLHLMPDSDPHRAECLHSMGYALFVRFEQLDDIEDLERSIPIQEEALRLTPLADQNRGGRLGNLARFFSVRYQRSGDATDLEKSIEIEEEALELVHDRELEGGMMGSLARSLLTRYKRSGNVIDLEKSIQMGKEALGLTFHDDPDRAVRLGNVANALVARYERSGDVADLENVIEMEEEAVELTPHDDPDRTLPLGNLARSLATRYQRFGNVSDLEKSIRIEEETLELTPRDDPVRVVRLGNLASSLSSRYKRFGNEIDLEKSMKIEEEALELTPYGDLDRVTRLGNLARSFSRRYERFGNIADLEKSIRMDEEALELTPYGDPNRALQLGNLGYSLSARYEHFGNIIDLERSVQMGEEALELTPRDDQNRAMRLGNFARFLSDRYERFGDVIDLKNMIEMEEEALELMPIDDPEKVLRLGNLAMSLSTRYEKVGEVIDLQRSIQMKEEALKLTPRDDPQRALRLGSLSGSLSTRYEKFEDIEDLEKSISMEEEALQLTPQGDPNRATRLTNLAISLASRHQRFSNIVKPEKPTSATIEAPLSKRGMFRCLQLRSIHTIRQTLFKRLLRVRESSGSDLSRVILYLSQAACFEPGPALDRFRASLLWIEHVSSLSQPDLQSLLDAYTVTVELLQRLAWVGSSLEDRLRHLLEASTVACDATAAALQSYLPELAVVWIEQGRSIVWTQLSQLRTPIDDLRIVHPEIAAQLEHVSRKLEGASTQDGARTDASTKYLKREKSSKNQTMDYTSLALERDGLLKKIRSLSGFERFLLPKTIGQLSSLVHSGPVVFLNASKLRCDALIIMAGSERLIHVPLLEITYDELQGMRQELVHLLTCQDRVIRRDNSNRAVRLVKMNPDTIFQSILSTLWDKVVSLIIDALSLMKSTRELPRIFWCPTGPFSFLPIHAAGRYTNGTRKLSDFAISSYIPSISALRKPPQEPMDATSRMRNIQLLAVRQPSTDGQTPLHKVPKEIEIIKELVNSSSFIDFHEADGTVEDVIAKMTRFDWVHFACHGTQDLTDPLNSGLLLADRRRLKISDIAQMSRQAEGGLAFLSACETATGDEELSEEAIHLAAGMLLAGYKGVIATMWSINDGDAPKVTEDVYKCLIRDGEVPESERGAEALHYAVERLRESGASFLSWVPFIHVGL